MVDVDDAQVPAAEQGIHVGAEVDRDAAGEDTPSQHPDAERFAHAAVCAVGGHHVLRAHVVGGARVAMRDHGVHVVALLFEGDEIRGEAELGAEFLGLGPQQRFEEALRDEDALAGADVANALVQVGNEVAELLAGKRFDGHDGAVLDELLVGFVAHDLFDADRAQDLHRALGDLRRARMDCRPAMMFDGECGNPVMAEQQRGGHADEAAADDQDRDFNVGHADLNHEDHEDHKEKTLILIASCSS